MLLVWLLPLTATGGAVGAAVTAGSPGATVETAHAVSGPTETTPTRELVLTKEVRLTPDRPGEITVTLRYETPTDLTGLRVELPESGTAMAGRGFSEGDGRYVWDGRTRTPTLTYRLSVNETSESAGPIARDGDYLFADAGPWALVRTPQVGMSWTGRSEISLSRSTTVAGPGAVGDGIMYLGEAREYQRTAHGQTFRLVVPASASLAERPADVFDALAASADALRVGDRDPEVFMVAAPTGSVEWAVDGLQSGESAFWVRDRSRLDAANNVWIHEYVHTRQDHELTPETRWFTEASATYYAALFALEQGSIDYETFRSRLALGERATDAEAILTTPSTWNGVAPYTKGALVAGELDRATRLATTDASLQTVFRRMNAHDGPVTRADLRAMIRATAGSRVAALSDEYTASAATPSMWGRAEHQRTFDTPLPNVGYAFADPGTDSAFSVSGPYRTGAIGATGPIRLATGETLTATILVSNTGAGTGEYEARARVNGATVARDEGTLAANETKRWQVQHAFTSPGEYALQVGESMVDVVVSPPATPTVSRFSSDTADPIVGDRLVLTATVRNADAVPAASNLTLFEDGSPVETRRVVLGPGENRTLAFERTPDTAGTSRYRLGDRNLTVTVRQPPTASDATQGSTAGSGPGFGAGVAALVVLASLAARVRG
ncbi:glycyl aminopeptidase [Halorientalis brevis]|uniref:Glycyl aminopeptidase n=1 Tax=Halorientalis brevis TaxID=1126241 RepID=A0ABD6C945_9EURY|nr:glycyl aminopeptidase [Halorientalis brevis]